MILAGDIGGTKVNLALFEPREGRPFRHSGETYSSQDYASLEGIVRAFLSGKSASVKHACFGIAGPVREGRAQLTNLNWVVDAAAMERALDLDQVSLINDLESNAYGIAALEPDDLLELNRGNGNPAGTKAIIAAGTGLGEAALVWNGTQHIAMASEGGHTDFAPRTDLDIELLKYLRARLGQVSWENVVSGPGSYHIYQFLRDTGRGEEPAWLTEQFRDMDPPVAITRAALEDRCDLCVQTLQLFVTYYGAEAGHLALKTLATGGVYIGGGIAPKILPKLQDGTFLRAFIGAGRMKDLLAAMPVRVILNDKTALIGAARYAMIRSGKMPVSR